MEKMMVDEKDDRERHRAVKLVIKEWRTAKNAEPEICVSFIAIREHLTEETLPEAQRTHGLTP